MKERNIHGKTKKRQDKSELCAGGGGVWGGLPAFAAHKHTWYVLTPREIPFQVSSNLPSMRSYSTTSLLLLIAAAKITPSSRLHLKRLFPRVPWDLRDFFFCASIRASETEFPWRQSGSLFGNFPECQLGSLIKLPGVSRGL